jgi:polar amino acid transport system substrate-binding protein
MRFLLLFLVAIHISFANAQEEITVVTENWPPYNYLNKDGKLVGNSTAVVHQVLSDADIKYKILVYPWARSFQIASQKKNTLIYSIYKTKEREDKFHWFCPIIKPTPMHFYQMATKPTIEFKNMEQAKQYTIGIIRGDWSHSYLLNLGFKEGEQLDLAPEMSINTGKLLAGRIDLLVNSDLGMKLELKKHNLPFSSVTKLFSIDLTGQNEICMAINKDSSQSFIQKISVAFERFKNSEKSR